MVKIINLEKNSVGKYLNNILHYLINIKRNDDYNYYKTVDRIIASFEAQACDTCKNAYASSTAQHGRAIMLSLVYYFREYPQRTTAQN